MRAVSQLAFQCWIQSCSSMGDVCRTVQSHGVINLKFETERRRGNWRTTTGSSHLKKHLNV